MVAEAAGVYRRTPAERTDQLLSWRRPDQAFFASGACHILAWACREAYPRQSIGIAALREPNRAEVFHTYATWGGWALDHSGWQLESELVDVNELFENSRLERVEVCDDLTTFCRNHRHRIPDQFYADPTRRARVYLHRFDPPWIQS